jgi:hypothetical protein
MKMYILLGALHPAAADHRKVPYSKDGGTWDVLKISIFTGQRFPI